MRWSDRLYFAVDERTFDHLDRVLRLIDFCFGRNERNSTALGNCRGGLPVYGNKV